jgi:hypothetical protein
VRLTCNNCGKIVSTEVPDNTVVRACLECPECIEKQYVSKKLKVTNTKTGKVWIQENQQHSWEELAIEIVNALEHSGLVFCDIECLVQSDDGTWYILDECSHWEYIPELYKVERI